MPRSAAQVICKGCDKEFERPFNGRATYCSKLCRLTYQKKWYQENKERYRDTYLKKTYNFSLADVEELKTLQNHECAICKISLNLLTPKNTHIDHCHETGVVRGILCINCNTGLGSFNDKPDLLFEAVRYLQNG